MKRLELKSSKFMFVLFAAGALYLCGYGVYLLLRSLNNWWGAIILILSLLALIKFIRELLDSRPRVVISNDGIYDKLFNVGTIPWEDIANAELKVFNDKMFISLKLKDEEKYLSKLTPFQRRIRLSNTLFKMGPFSIGLYGLDKQPDVVFDYILEFLKSRTSKI